jgi:hypothetical protein
MGLIQWDTLNVSLLHDLLLMGLRTVGCHRLKPINGLESHRTDIGGALITDTPPLTFQELFYGRFGEFTAGHQGPLPCGALPVACRAAQPFDVFVLACPRPMHNVPFAGPMEVQTRWMRTRESRIPLLRWRR